MAETDPCEKSKMNYSVSTDSQKWGKARVECKKLGMDLVSIETEEENTCIKEKIQLAGEIFSSILSEIIIHNCVLKIRSSEFCSFHCAEQNGPTKLHLANRIGGRNQWMGHW
jgi:hypothetical protein